MVRPRLFPRAGSPTVRVYTVVAKRRPQNGWDLAAPAGSRASSLSQVGGAEETRCRGSLDGRELRGERTEGLGVAIFLDHFDHGVHILGQAPRDELRRAVAARKGMDDPCFVLRVFARA